MDTMTDVEYSLEERKEGNVDSGCCTFCNSHLWRLEHDRIKTMPLLRGQSKTCAV